MMPIFAFFVVLVSKVSLAYLDMIMVEITTRLIKNGISPHARKGDTRRGVHARVSHALLSLRKNGGLLVVYFSHHLAHNLQPLVLCISRGGGGSFSSDSKRLKNAEDDTKNIWYVTIFIFLTLH